MQKNTNLAALEEVLSQKHGPTLEEIEERLKRAKAEQAQQAEPISAEVSTRLDIKTAGDKVVMEFAPAGPSLSLSPQQARAVAGMLLEKANKIEPSPRKKRRQRKGKN